MSHEEIKNLERDIAVMNNEITNIAGGVRDIKKTLEDYIKSEGERHDKQDKKFTDALKEKADKQDILDDREEIKDIKDNIKWIVRIVISAVVMAGLGVIFINK